MRLSITMTSAAVACAALLLTGCGGSDDDGDGGKSDKIAGAKENGKGDETAKPTDSADTPAAPEFALPSDVKVDIADDETGDKVKDEILRDHGYGLMAMQEAYAKTEPTPNFKRYWDGLAASKYEASFAEYRKNGQTIAGTDRFYARAVMSHEGEEALVTFCEDQTEAFDKDVESGEVKETEPTDNSFIDVRTVLKKNSAGDWQIVEFEGQRGSKSCRQES